MYKMSLQEIMDEFFNHFNEENITNDDVKHVEIIVNAFDEDEEIYGKAFRLTIKNNFDCISLESIDVNDISIIELYIITNNDKRILIPEECMGY